MDIPVTLPKPVPDTLARLRADLDVSPIPSGMVDRNLLIATWNIRGFGRVTP